MSTSFLGFEIGFYPALFLLFLLLGGAIGAPVYARTVVKKWSGERERHPISRFRTFATSAFFFLAGVSTTLALADVTRQYSVQVVERTISRLFATLDNSGSMHGFWSYPHSVIENPWPIYCSNANVAHSKDARPDINLDIDIELEHALPRVYGSCRMVFRMIDAVERDAVRSKSARKDILGIFRFAQNSYVVTHGTTDYARVRRLMRTLNWRDPRTGISTMYHIALWDMFQVALQRNFCAGSGTCQTEDGIVPLDARDRELIARSLWPESIDVPWTPPPEVLEKLEALRANLSDTALVVITDADKRWFDSALNVAPVSLVKMLSMAEFLEVPVYFISMVDDHELVRPLTERTGRGPMGSPDRGAFFLLTGERDFADMDAVVDNIVSRRFRLVSTKTELRRETYTPFFGLLAAIFLMAGTLVAWSRFGRVIGKGGAP